MLLLFRISAIPKYQHISRVIFRMFQEAVVRVVWTEAEELSHPGAGFSLHLQTTHAEKKILMEGTVPRYLQVCNVCNRPAWTKNVSEDIVLEMLNVL